MLRVASPSCSLLWTNSFVKQLASSLHLASDSFPAIPKNEQIAVPVETNLPERAQVVIAGAGMIGNAGEILWYL